uniref:Vacuolar protein sorting-associated protein 33B n=1 Tax=Clastoptera arizonana TaxID=38151 RepID=A0A1B6DTV4_9HEMI
MQNTLDKVVGSLNLISQRRLTDLLDKIPGQKDFIIDRDLIKPLEKIVGVIKLRSHGVGNFYKLDKSTVASSASQVVYFIPSNLVTAKYVCDQIKSVIRQNNKKYHYYIILFPKKITAIDQLFEEEGIHGNVTLYGFQWELINLDSNILSLEHEQFFQTTFVESDQSFLPSVAKSIWTLQMLFGKPQITLLQGKLSQQIYLQLEMLFDKLGFPERKDTDIGYFLVVDRDIDFASMLLTPGTYTSLLDEVFGIKSSIVDFQIIGKNVEKENKPKGHQLSSHDEIYSQIKNRHFSDVFRFLSNKAKDLQVEYKRSQNMPLQEMKRYISQELQNITNVKATLAYHISACESIISNLGPKFESLQNVEQNMLEGRNRRENNSYIEDCIAMGLCNKVGALRLSCLQSITQDGMSSDELNNVKNEFLHAFGYKYLTSFHKLERLGLLTEQHSLISSEATAGIIASKVVQVVSLPTNRRSAFYTMAQKLKLFPELQEKYDLKNPKDMSYVFNGAYIPAVCQIANILLKQELSFDELIKIVPNCSLKMNKSIDKPLRTMFIYFVGGFTYAEAAACQLLEKLTGAQIFISGTSVNNGNRLMESCL